MKARQHFTVLIMLMTFTFSTAQEDTDKKENETEKKATIKETVKYLNAFNTNFIKEENEQGQPYFRYDKDSNRITIEKRLKDDGRYKWCNYKIVLKMDYLYEIIDNPYSKKLEVKFENEKARYVNDECFNDYPLTKVILRYKEPRVAKAFMHLLKMAHANRKNKYETLKF